MGGRLAKDFSIFSLLHRSLLHFKAFLYVLRFYQKDFIDLIASIISSYSSQCRFAEELLWPFSFPLYFTFHYLTFT